MLKLTKAQFALLTGLTNAANVLLVPLIPIPNLVAFTAIALNLVLVYLGTETIASDSTPQKQ